METGPASAVIAITLLRVFEVHHIDRDRLCPAKPDVDHHKQTDQVNVLDRIEGKPAHKLCCIVPQSVCHIPMGYLVKRNADEGWNDSGQYIYEQIPVYVVQKIRQIPPPDP